MLASVPQLYVWFKEREGEREGRERERERERCERNGYQWKVREQESGGD